MLRKKKNTPEKKQRSKPSATEPILPCFDLNSGLAQETSLPAMGQGLLGDKDEIGPGRGCRQGVDDGDDEQAVEEFHYNSLFR
jgi:hypothetical protein